MPDQGSGLPTVGQRHEAPTGATGCRNNAVTIIVTVTVFDRDLTDFTYFIVLSKDPTTLDTFLYGEGEAFPDGAVVFLPSLWRYPCDITVSLLFYFLIRITLRFSSLLSYFSPH